MDLPDFSEAAAARLREQVQDRIQPSNPLDTGGSWADPTKPLVYPLTLETFGAEPDFDVIISRFTVPRTGSLGSIGERLEEMEAARQSFPDKLFAVLARTSDQFSDEWAQAVRERRIAFLQGYGRGLRALGRLGEYSRKVHGGSRAPGAIPASTPPRPTGRTLSEIDSKTLLAAAGIPVVKTVAVATADGAAHEAERLGFPVVLKVIAPEIVHKSDAGGVALGLQDGTAVRQAFADLRGVAHAAGANFEGVAVQSMARPGLEIVLGTHRAAQFGPVLLFGLGGIFVEVLRDVALRVAPLGREDARAMLDEIQGAALLSGLRGQAPVDREAIVQALLRLSALMLSRPDIASIDINPALAYPDGLLAVDARVELTD